MTKDTIKYLQIGNGIIVPGVHLVLHKHFETQDMRQRR